MMMILSAILELYISLLLSMTVVPRPLRSLCSYWSMPSLPIIDFPVNGYISARTVVEVESVKRAQMMT